MSLKPGQTGAPNPSFAKVAAMTHSQDVQPQVSSSSISSLETVDENSTTNTSISSGPPAPQAVTKTVNSDPASSVSDHHEQDFAVIAQKAATLELKEEGTTLLQKNDECGYQSQTMGAEEGSYAAVGLRATASEISIKPSSVDGKSTTSVTTFAMDEKESLRPDDSASIRANEDEDISAPVGSAGATSRVGSEHGAKAFRAQFHEISERMGYSQQEAVTTVPYIEPVHPQSMAADVVEPKAVHLSTKSSLTEATGGTHVPLGFSSIHPDPKLLEALENPKDRLFLLRLEQKVVEFVKDSKDPALDLPPCNSFCRLLIHKLADYYFLTHFVDTSTNSIRVFRTPFCRLPPPLTGISNPPTSGHTPPPAGPTMKIMRRGNLEERKTKQPSAGETMNSSQEASKASSVTDGDVEPDSTRESTGSGGKDKSNLTREEREAKYKEARERIFKGFEETENDEHATGGENTRQHSRSNSGGAKNRSSGKRHNNGLDDGFEARSQFAPYYPPPNSISPFAGVSHGNPYTMQTVNLQSNAFHGTYGSDFHGYPTGFAHQSSPQSGPQYTTSSSVYSDVAGNGMTQCFPQGVQSSSGFAMQHKTPMGDYHAPSSSLNNPAIAPMMFGQQTYPHQAIPAPWQNVHPIQYQGTHPSAPYTNLPSVEKMLTSQPSGASPLYPYGQMPSHMFPPNSHQVNHQHPVPGSYNGHAFDPQTQPFIPWGNTMGGQPNQYNQNSSHQGAVLAVPENGNSKHIGAQTHAGSPSFATSQGGINRHARAFQAFGNQPMASHASNFPPPNVFPGWTHYPAVHTSGSTSSPRLGNSQQYIQYQGVLGRSQGPAIASSTQVSAGS